MESLPDVSLLLIFDALKFRDIKALLQTPTWRNIILSFYSIPINKKDLLRKSILECIEQLESEIETNLMFEVIDFFEERGFEHFNQTPVYLSVLQEFLSKITPSDMNLIRNLFQVKNKKEMINYIQENFTSIAQIRRKIKTLTTSRDILNFYQDKIDDLEKEHEKEFYNQFVRSYDNVQAYLEVVSNYINEFLVDKFPEEIARFTKCVEQRQIFIYKSF